jgi:hypothetical protein
LKAFYFCVTERDQKEARKVNERQQGMFECLSAASLSSVLFPNGRNRVAVRKSDTWQRCFHSTIQDFRISFGFNSGSDNDTDSDIGSESDSDSDSDTDSDNGSESDGDIDCNSETDSDIDSELH